MHRYLVSEPAEAILSMLGDALDLVEFGIVAILVVMILFAIVDFGLLLNGWMTVNAGAPVPLLRYAIKPPMTARTASAATRAGRRFTAPRSLPARPWSAAPAPRAGR